MNQIEISQKISLVKRLSMKNDEKIGEGRFRKNG